MIVKAARKKKKNTLFILFGMTIKELKNLLLSLLPIVKKNNNNNPK